MGWRAHVLTGIVEGEPLPDGVRRDAVAAREPFHALVAVDQQIFRPHAGAADHRLAGHLSRYRLDRRTFVPVDLHVRQYSIQLLNPKPVDCGVRSYREARTPDAAALACGLVWFVEPAEAWSDTVRFIAYALARARATHEDIKILRAFVTDDVSREAIDRAPPGIIAPRSWAY